LLPFWMLTFVCTSLLLLVASLCFAFLHLVSCSSFPFHAGFMKSSMTEPFKDKYDELGAVEPHVAAKGVVECMKQLNKDNTGRFIQPLGSENLGFGVWGLEEAEKKGPMSELPW